MPLSFLSIFSPHELKLMVCGKPDLDLDHLISHTIFKYLSLLALLTGYTTLIVLGSDRGFTPRDQVVKEWLWDCIREMEPDVRLQFFSFVTSLGGTCPLPLYART